MGVYTGEKERVVEVIYKEIHRLATMLDKADIPLDIESMLGGSHVMYPSQKNVICSVEYKSKKKKEQEEAIK